VLEKNKIMKILPLLLTLVMGIISAPIFYNWYIRPVVVVDIKEFELPKVYTETIQEQLSKIPRISIIEIRNVGKSIGGILSLDFKTNNNTTLQGVSIESRSNVLKYATEEPIDGSSVIKVDMEFIRPNEKVIIKALTDIKANFFIEEKLITNGEILTSEAYEKRNAIVENISIVVIGMFILFVIGWISNLIDKHKARRLAKSEK